MTKVILRKISLSWTIRKMVIPMRVSYKNLGPNHRLRLASCILVMWILTIVLPKQPLIQFVLYPGVNTSVLYLITVLLAVNFGRIPTGFKDSPSVQTDIADQGFPLLLRIIPILVIVRLMTMTTLQAPNPMMLTTSGVVVQKTRSNRMKIPTGVRLSTLSLT